MLVHVNWCLFGQNRRKGTAKYMPKILTCYETCFDSVIIPPKSFGEHCICTATLRIQRLPVRNHIVLQWEFCPKVLKYTQNEYSNDSQVHETNFN